MPIMVTFCADQLAGTDINKSLKPSFTVMFTYGAQEQQLGRDTVL